MRYTSQLDMRNAPVNTRLACTDQVDRFLVLKGMVEHAACLYDPKKAHQRVPINNI